MSKAKIKRKLRQAARLFDIDPKLLFLFATLESSWRPDAVNKGSGARGLFQYLAMTAKEEALADPHNVAEAAAVTAERVDRYVRYLQRNKVPTEAVYVYLIHQQGFVGFQEIFDVAHGRRPELSAARIRNMRANIPAADRSLFESVANDHARAMLFLDSWANKVKAARW
jgi:hypothetical protein